MNQAKFCGRFEGINISASVKLWQQIKNWRSSRLDETSTTIKNYFLRPQNQNASCLFGIIETRKLRRVLFFEKFRWKRPRKRSSVVKDFFNYRGAEEKNNCLFYTPTVIQETVNCGKKILRYSNWEVLRDK